MRVLAQLTRDVAHLVVIENGLAALVTSHVGSAVFVS